MTEYKFRSAKDKRDRDREFKIGDRVGWPKAYSYLMFLEPFEIRAIEGDFAYLCWISSPVKLAELRRID